MCKRNLKKKNVHYALAHPICRKSSNLDNNFFLKVTKELFKNPYKCALYIVEICYTINT